MRLNSLTQARYPATLDLENIMGTPDSAWTRNARPILTERDYDAVQLLVVEAVPEQPRTLALMRELADYESRGSALNAAAAWAEWVFVPRSESDAQPKRRWIDAPLGFMGSFAIR
jgi:hypothetical protein